MNILQICNKPPFPPQDGGSIGMNNITNGLLDFNHKVKVIAVNPPKHFVNINDLPPDYVSSTRLELVYMDTSVKLFAAFKNLFTSQSYHIQRFISEEFDSRLISILKNETFDIVQIESIFLMSYMDTIRKYSKAKVILRSPNIEYLIWKRMTKTAINPLKKWYLSILTKRLKKFEFSQLNKADAVYTVTINDMDFYKSHGCKVPITFIPTGIDMTKKLDVDFNKVEFPSIFHIGALDWLPNQEGIQWFLKNVWDRVHLAFPQLKFYIAGRNTPQWLFNINKPNVEVLGEIADAGEFISSKSIMLVPLMSGSGMRVKIIEGMMLGKAIISTTIGVEGIIYQSDGNILIANSPDEFFNAISRCVQNRSFCEEIGKKALLNAENNYDNNLLTKKLIRFFEEIMN